VVSERRKHIEVGVLFVLSIVVLVSGVLWFKDFQFAKARLQVMVEFPSTSGLVKGDPVEVRGVPSGQVKETRFENGRALVMLQLDRSAQPREGTRFVIENVGIMGQKMVAVYPPEQTAPLAPEGTIFIGQYQPGIPQLMEELGGTLDAFGRIAIRLESIMEGFDETQEGSLRRTLASTEVVATETATFMRESRDDLSGAIRNFNSAMEQLNLTLDGRADTVGRMLENTERAAGHLDSTLTALDRATSRVDSLLLRINRGDGSLGRALADEQLYEELVSTLRETRTLVADVRANPKKYVKLSLF
jgi:phospholipid/cholesterol/gamma-HCH transport system substrate-binding protein